MTSQTRRASAVLALAVMGMVAGATLVAADVLEAPLDAHGVRPDGWGQTTNRAITDGLGLQVLVETTGPVVNDWWQATNLTLLRDPDGRQAVIYAHRFDTAAHAREVWLGVLRLAEEPDVALAPRVLEDAPDVLVYGAATSDDPAAEDSILAEEAHRVVGRDVVILVMTLPDVGEGLPSAAMSTLITEHRAAFPQDQFDLPSPGGQGLGTSGVILLVVLVIAGTVIVISAALLLRRRHEAD